MMAMYVVMYHGLDEVHYPIAVFHSRVNAEKFAEDEGHCEIYSHDVEEVELKD